MSMGPTKLTRPDQPLSSALYRADKILAGGNENELRLKGIEEVIKRMRAEQSDCITHAKNLHASTHSAYVIALERDALALAIKDIVENMNGDLVAVWQRHPIIEVALAS